MSVFHYNKHKKNLILQLPKKQMWTVTVKHTAGMCYSAVTTLTKKNYTKIYVTYTWNILHIYISYIYSLCRYMLAICICYIYVELGPTYMWHKCKYMGSIWDWYIYVELGPTYTWHICKYMGSIWDWEKEKKTSKPTASLWNWPIKLNWSSLNREMDACLWEDRIVFDFVHFILIQASLSYNHIYIFCITLLSYRVFIYLHYFTD